MLEQCFSFKLWCIHCVYASVSPSADPFTEVLNIASCLSASEMAASTSWSSTASCVLISRWYSMSANSVGDSAEHSVSSSGRLRCSMSLLSSAASSCFWVRSSRRPTNDFCWHTHTVLIIWRLWSSCSHTQLIIVWVKSYHRHSNNDDSGQAVHTHNSSSHTIDTVMTTATSSQAVMSVDNKFHCHHLRGVARILHWGPQKLSTESTRIKALRGIRD